MKISAIYQIQSFIEPEKIYIGSAINIENRWRCHLSDLIRNKHHSSKLQNHYNKYGKTDLEFSVLLECDKESLIANEQNFIDILNPYFNISKKAGSRLGTNQSPETKDKIRKALTGGTHKDKMDTFQRLENQRASRRKWNKEHPEKLKEADKKYYYSHPDKAIEKINKRREKDLLIKNIKIIL